MFHLPQTRRNPEHDMTPIPECKGLTFFPEPEFNDASVAFGAKNAAYFDLDDLPDVPSQYEHMAEELFFSGGQLPDLHPAVDQELALRAVQAWLSSFAPAHEAKISTVAYALWLWTHPDALGEQ